MQIREASVPDLAGIKMLYSQLNPDDPEISDDRDLALLELIAGSEGLFLFVGMLDGAVVSTCYLNVIPNLSRNRSPYGIIENVVADC